jgi:hypothetical protein
MAKIPGHDAAWTGTAFIDQHIAAHEQVHAGIHFPEEEG